MRFILPVTIKGVFTSTDHTRYKLWSCPNVCDALSFLLDNIYIRYGTKIYHSDSYKLCSSCCRFVFYSPAKRFNKSLSDDNQPDNIEAFNSMVFRYLDDLLYIDNSYFEGMVNQIYPHELLFNKANSSDTEPLFLDLHLSLSNIYVSSKLYDIRDEFDIVIVNFPFLDGDVPRRPSYGVYIYFSTYKIC